MLFPSLQGVGCPSSVILWREILRGLRLLKPNLVGSWIFLNIPGRSSGSIPWGTQKTLRKQDRRLWGDFWGGIRTLSSSFIPCWGNWRCLCSWRKFWFYPTQPCSASVAAKPGLEGVDLGEKNQIMHFQPKNAALDKQNLSYSDNWWVISLIYANKACSVQQQGHRNAAKIYLLCFSLGKLTLALSVCNQTWCENPAQLWDPFPPRFFCVKASLYLCILCKGNEIKVQMFLPLAAQLFSVLFVVGLGGSVSIKKWQNQIISVENWKFLQGGIAAALKPCGVWIYFLKMFPRAWIPGTGI